MSRLYRHLFSGIRTASSRMVRVGLGESGSLVSPQYSIRSFILPAVRPLTAPKKAFVRNRAWGISPANAERGSLSYEDGDDHRPLSGRAPFRKPHPLPPSVQGRPDGDAARPARASRRICVNWIYFTFGPCLPIFSFFRWTASGILPFLHHPAEVFRTSIELYTIAHGWVGARLNFC